MKFNLYPKKLKKTVSGELFIFILVLVFTFLLAFVTHLADFFDRIIHRYQASLAGELIIMSIVFAVVSWMYTIKRMKEYKHSVISIKQMQEATRKSEERFYLASQATRDVIYEWDPVKNEVWISDHIFSSFGYDKPETAITIDWWMSKVHPDDIDRVIATSHEYIEQKKNTWIGEYRFKKADGSYAFAYDRAHIAYDDKGNFLRWIGSMTDITEMKNTQGELRLAKEKAEESVRAKSEFLANMSHEIRTPLNGIIGMIDLIAESELTPEQKRRLGTLNSCCDTLLGLINDILDFSKNDAGKLELSPVEFSLRDEIAKELQSLGLKTSEKGLEAGMDDYISKPVRSQELMNAIERCGQNKSHTQYGTDKALVSKPKVNMHRLFADLDKSDDEMEKILTLFEEDALRLLKDIELAVKAGRMAEAGTLLHTLRGQCGLVDMYTVNEIAEQLEFHAANKRSVEVEQLLPRLSQELRESLGEMQVIRIVNK